MASGFTFRSAPTFRDLQGRFARAEKELLVSRRAAMRTLGRRYAALAQTEAPGGVGHTVAAQIGFSTFVEAGAVGFKTRLGQIARWHVSGTGIYGPRRQVIRPTHAQALHFFIGAHEFFRKWVRGLHPNPFLGRAYRRWLPGARPELRRIALRYARTLAGQTTGGRA